MISICRELWSEGPVDCHAVDTRQHRGVWRGPGTGDAIRGEFGGGEYRVPHDVRVQPGSVQEGHLRERVPGLTLVLHDPEAGPGAVTGILQGGELHHA